MPKTMFPRPHHTLGCSCVRTMNDGAGDAPADVAVVGGRRARKKWSRRAMHSIEAVASRSVTLATHVAHAAAPALVQPRLLKRERPTGQGARKRTKAADTSPQGANGSSTVSPKAAKPKSAKKVKRGVGVVSVTSHDGAGPEPVKVKRPKKAKRPKRAKCDADTLRDTEKKAKRPKRAKCDADTLRDTEAHDSAPADAHHPLLVLLDLNGVLVHRSSPGPTTPFTVRPGTVELLEILRDRVDVGFCTSMSSKNALRAIEKVRIAAHEATAQGALALLKSAPCFAGDDFHFRNDVGVPLLPLRVPSLEPYRMLRNLDEVWRSKLARGHTARSTILVDDTEGKCPLSPSSVLLLASSWDGDPGSPTGDARVLQSLGAHLLVAAAAQAAAKPVADVRDWLAKHPFRCA